MREKALQRAMRICSQSEKCPKDIKDKMYQWGVAKELHQGIIEELLEKNFIDIERFTKSFTHDKIYLSIWGKQKVFFALKSKEIGEEIIQGALEQVDEDVYLKGLSKLLETKKKSIKSKNEYDLRIKLIRFGQGRGFSIDEINEVLNDYGE